MRRSLHTLLAVLLLALATAFAAGCGGDDEPKNEPSAPAKPTPPEPPQQQTGQAALKAAGIDVTTGAYQGLEFDTRQGTPPPAGGAGASLEQAARDAGCTLKLNLRDEGNHHLEAGEPHPNYKTNPPTSGSHDPVPVADGSYRETPPDVNYVHSLEHGRVEIQYSSSLPEDQQLALKGIFDESPGGMLLFPNDDMPYEVAATAWTNLMGCEKVEDADALVAAVLAFRDRFRGKGPEAVPYSGM